MAEQKKAKLEKPKKVKTTVSIKLLQKDLDQLGLFSKDAEGNKISVTIKDGSKIAELALRAKYRLEPRKAVKASKRKEVATKLGLDPEKASKSDIYDAMLKKLE